MDQGMGQGAGNGSKGNRDRDKGGEGKGKGGKNTKGRMGKKRRRQRLVELGNAGGEGKVAEAGSEVGKGIVELDRRDDAGLVGVKRQRREERRQEHIASRLWRSFDRGSDDCNPAFSSYYQSQLGLGGPDKAGTEAWRHFLESLATDLQVTFRLNRGRFPVQAKALAHRLGGSEFRFAGSFIRVGADKVIASAQVVNPVEWLRDAYQVGVDRIGFSKAPALEPLHSLVAREARLGHLARQGIASMLPAIVLNPASHELVLDMCAAPGSKSEQLLQMMGSRATGAVMINDADPKRLGGLLKRFAELPHPNLIVTCSRGEDLYANLGSERFDAIVCDVPCSGDGTIRKYAYLWRRWRASKALLIHPLQLQLAKAAASLLKTGGRMVYSTCSINPVEDEAVVAALLKAAGGALVLRKIKVPGFHVRKGLHSWKSDEAFFNDCRARDETQATREREQGPDNMQSEKTAHSQKKKDKGSKSKRKAATRDENAEILPTMLAPSAEEAKSMQLERCARVLHCDNNTEGFFLALIEKVGPWEDPALQSMSAKSAKEMLKTLGFNPRLISSGSGDGIGIAPLESARIPRKSLQQLCAATGITPERVESGRVRIIPDTALTRSKAGTSVAAFRVSDTVRELLEEKWATSGRTPVLAAGMAIACLPGAATARDIDYGAMVPTSAGSLEHACDLFSEQSDMLQAAQPEEMFALLQLVAESAAEQQAEAEKSAKKGSDRQADDNDDIVDEDAGDDPMNADHSDRRQKPPKRDVSLSIAACVDLLEDEDSDEEESDQESQPAINNAVAQAIVDCPVGAPIFIGLETKQLLALCPEHDATGQGATRTEAAAPSSRSGSQNGRLSAAQRRKLKKAQRKGAKVQAPQQYQVQNSTSSKEDELKPAQTDMYSLTANEQSSPLCMALAFRKISPSILIVLTDMELIMSYGQTLQTIHTIATTESQ